MANTLEIIPGFGQRLKLTRITKGYKATQVCKYFDITSSTLSNWENDKHMPSHPMVVKLSKYYGVTVDFLYGVEREKPIFTDGLHENQVEALQVVADRFRKDNEEHEKAER